MEGEQYSDRTLARHEEFMERAAILEWDAGLPQELAVRVAFALVYDLSRMAQEAGAVMDHPRVEEG